SKCGKPPFTSDEEREWNAIDVALKTIGKKGMAIGVLPNSPAERAGLKNGWAILSVDGKSLVGMNINDAVLLIRGEAGTTVTLGIVESPSDASAPNEKRISVVRGAVTIMHVTGKVIETKGAGGGTQKIGYLKIDAFMGDADKQFEKQLAALGVGKLIIDVRGNGGGDARSVYRILKSLLPMNAPTAYFVRKNGDMKELGTIYPSIRALFSLSSTLVFSGKLVVLIDGNSASASEIFAGALRDHKRATLIGEKTFGKGSVQTIYSLPDGTILKLTTALYALPSKEFIDGKGIEPHIKVAETLATGEAGDKVFDAAIAFLAKEKE
ncbi:MAG: PDZ domain-containing protein, partial [Parcubacteria group bacterium]|nr:PDZ domain-containing protein [Parcubacteria group bacterium]